MTEKDEEKVQREKEKVVPTWLWLLGITIVFGLSILESILGIIKAPPG